MDRLCPYRAGALPPTLMKLRDLPSGRWNADRLLTLTSDKEVGRKLAAICEEKMPGGMVHVYADPEVVDHALGQGRCGKAIISIWWD